jgi:hypothetical protein
MQALRGATKAQARIAFEPFVDEPGGDGRHHVTG